MSVLDIRLLGGFHLSSGGQPVSEQVSSRARSLLAYLLLHRDEPQSRRRLAFLLWPDSGEAQAHTNLRRELHLLRKVLPDAERFLEIENRTLRWRSGERFELDVARFEADLDASRVTAPPDQRVAGLRRAVDLYVGELLPDNYEAWLEAERERLDRLFCLALEQLVGELELDRRYEEALEYGRRLQQHDPLQERTYRTMMRLHSLTGDTAGATRAYAQCVALLSEQLDVAPGPETEALYVQLQGRAPGPSAPPRSRRDARSGSLVGRDEEWRELLRAWQTACASGPRVVVTEGEAGVGKTRLAEELLEWAIDQGIPTARARCYRAEGRLALGPVAEWFRAPPIAEALAGLDGVWLSEVSRVLPELVAHEPHSPGSQAANEAWQRRRLFEALSLATTAAPQPLLLLLDDAQWCDRETLEWLHHLLRFDPGARFLVLLTARSEERADNPALDALLLDLRRTGHSTEMTLGPLDLGASAELAGRVYGRKLEPAEASAIFDASEGHPLFVIEMARAGLTGGQWRDAAQGARARALPPRVQALIKTRLAQLSPPARSVAGLAAAVGRNFSLEQLRAATDLDEPTLVSSLDELWRRQLVREHDDQSFDFCHDRIREVAYAELGPAQRRVVHRRLAQGLEQLHSDDLDATSSQIAAHYEQAGLLARAVHFYERAAHFARRVAASREAVRLLRHGLALLQRLPASHERDRLELSLQYALSAPLNITLGFASPELEASLERVRLLGERLGRPQAVIGSLVGLFGVNFVQGKSLAARAMGEEAVALAEQYPDLLAQSHFALGGALFSLGLFEPANESFERSARADTPTRSGSLVFGTDLEVFRHSYAAHTLWQLGKTEAAAVRAGRAIERALALEDPFNLAVANAYAALTHQFLGNVPVALAHAETVRTLCERYGYAYYAQWGQIIRAWGLAQAGDFDSGSREMAAALETLDSAGARARRPYYLSLQASVLLGGGRPEEAMAVLVAALDHSRRCSETWWDAELLRSRGELELQLGGGTRAEETFREACRVAHRQGSRSLELRAALSLAQLLEGQGRRQESHASLALIVPELAAGSGSEELHEARRLLASET